MLRDVPKGFDDTLCCASITVLHSRSKYCCKEEKEKQILNKKGKVVSIIALSIDKLNCNSVLDFKLL